MTAWHANTELLVSEPFHYRNFTNPADQQKFAGCLQRAMVAIEKALAVNPECANTWSYRSLLYGEQQKITASPAERQRLANVAKDAAKRAIELTQKQRQ